MGQVGPRTFVQAQKHEQGMETGMETRTRKIKGQTREGMGVWKDKEREGAHTGERMKWGRETAMQKKKIRNWGTKKK